MLMDVMVGYSNYDDLVLTSLEYRHSQFQEQTQVFVMPMMEVSPSVD